VGRTTELARLDELVTGLADGRGGLAWVQGEPGVGKSALIDAVLAGAAAHGHAVLRAAGDELMQPFPLRLMADCLGISAGPPSPLAAEIAALLRGDLAGGPALDPAMAAAERMLDLIDRRCAAGPLVLVAEDLQWADEPSLLVWSRLARAAGQIPLLLIGTARPMPQQVRLDQLRDLVTRRAGTVIDLRPLDPASAAELAGQLARGAPGPRLREALCRAGGNPLYVRELVDALVREDLIRVSAGSAELHGDVAATPKSLRVAIRSRLGFLSAQALRTLQTAALLGNEFDAGELALVTGQRVSQVAGVLADAIACGVISGGGERLRFRHQLIHQVLLEQTPAGLRRVRHRRIARVLAQAGRPVDSVARHLLAVPGQLDGWALPWLATTPESALYALPQVSADLLGRAVESAGRDAALRETLATRLAMVAFWLGQDAQAARLAGSVVERTTDDVLAARMRIIVIRSAGRRNRPAEGLAAVLQTPGDDGLPAVWRSRLGAWSAQLRHFAGDRHGGAALAAAALEQATASGDPFTIACARYASAMCGDPAAAAEQVAAALAVLTGTDPESADLRILLTVARLVQAEYSGLAAEGESALAELTQLAERSDAFRAALIRATCATSCYRLGRWDEALMHLATIDPAYLDTAPLAPYHALVARIALHRGDAATASARLRACVGWRPETAADPPVPVSLITQALAMQAEAAGDLPRAVATMATLLAAVPGVRLHDRQDDDLTYLARLALAAGDTGTARAAAAAAEADGAGGGWPGQQAGAAFCRALLTGDAGGLLAVAEVYRRYGWLPTMAAAQEEAAACLAADGDAAGARAALTDAVRAYADLGATADIGRADARLRGYGIRRGPRTAQRRASQGWAALTPSEVKIARMVAGGLSNPDIASELYLSRRTVQTHVSNILGKLELRSRIDIMRTAAQQHEPARG